MTGEHGRFPNNRGRISMDTHKVGHTLLDHPWNWVARQPRKIYKMAGTKRQINTKILLKNFY